MESSLRSQRNHGSKTGGEEENEEINISTLPRKKGWNPLFDLYQYEGFWTFKIFLEGIISVQQNFKAKPNDIILCSAPKTGVTWLKAITFAIATRTQYFNDSTSPLFSKVPHECVPFLEVDFAQNSSNRPPAAEISLLATHTPYPSLPKSIISSGCKIVYICRDPKDTFVSMWYFVANQLASNGVEPIPMEEAFDLFCRGVSNYGPYWDHLLGYWKASLELPEKILFLKYEEMKKDTTFYITKLAEFIDYPFSTEEEKSGMAEKIVKMCCFENLSNLAVNRDGKHRVNTPLEIQNKVYFRKGKVGDWKNYLTDEMAAHLDFVTEQKLSGSGLTITSQKTRK